MCRTKLTNTASCLGPRSSPGLQEQGIRDVAEVRREEMDARHARSITILVLLLLLHALPRRCLVLVDKTALTAAAFYTASRSLRKLLLLLLLLLYPWVPSFPRVCSVGYVPKYTGGICSVYTLRNHTGVFGTASIPYRTIPECSVRTQYRYPTVRQGRYDLNTGTRQLRYELTTGNRHFGTFGTNSIPVPDTLVRVYRGYIPRVCTYLPYQSGSVQPQYRYPTVR